MPFIISVSSSLVAKFIYLRLLEKSYNIDI